MQVKERHDQIGLMCNSNCTRSIQDFDYHRHKNENVISINVRDPDAKRKIVMPRNSDISVKQLIKDYQNMPVIKNVDLNKKIDEEQLDSVIIDDSLARQLILQDENIEQNNMLNFPEIQNNFRIMPREDAGQEKEKPKKDIGEIGDQDELLANQLDSKRAFQSKNPRQMTPNPFYHA